MSGIATGVIGRRLVYIYANGWQYELYVKNDHSIDYRIHSGLVAGRWVKGQEVDLADLGGGRHKISWTEPTGTSVVVTIAPAERRLHGTIFFPRWVHENPERTVLFQNDHLELMRSYRDQGPTYPIHVVVEHASIIRIDDVGVDDERVIDCAPAELPEGFLAEGAPSDLGG